MVAVERFTAALARTPALRSRLFTESEQITLSGTPRSAQSLAARFAAKEAVAKVLGAPGGLLWHDCQVVSDRSGRPWLTISGTIARVATELAITDWHVSLSHDGPIASAVVVAENRGTP